LIATQPPGDPIGASPRRLAGFRVDGVIGLLLFAFACIWGTVYWNHAARGHLPFFYQSYFEPAVMIACGKGFVVAQPQVPAMSAFLAQSVDRFSCDAIPADAELGKEGLYQGAWRYLLVAVGVAWRVLGVSWSGMGPFFGLMFAATIVAAYAIFRLGTGPLVATLWSLVLSVSKLHLAYLPVLRDYAKAPFDLVLIFLLGLVVTRRPTWRGVLLLAVTYGVVLGFGYGFRTDFLANIPPFFVALFGFVQGGPGKNLRLKAAAAALCMAAFLGTAWPIISSVYGSGGCQWHAALLGFSTEFSGPLGVDAPPYQLSRRYSDNFAYVTSTSYAARRQPGIGHIEYCHPEYDRATGAYLMDLASRFPADMIVRAYASVRRIVELPFSWSRTGDPEPLSGDDERPEPGGQHGIGLALVVAAIGLASAASVRIGLFLLLFLLYFAGYPAIQFNARHYFHLEFITWWAAGFLVQFVISEVRLLIRGRERLPGTMASVRRAALLLAVSAAVLTLALTTARVYQQRAARTLLRSYIAAPREPIPIEDMLPGTPHPVPRASPHTDPETADFLEVDVNGWHCGDAPAVTFRYNRATRKEFSRRFVVHRTNVDGTTRIFMPVYDDFQTIELSDTGPGCVGGIYRVRNPGQFTVLLEAILPPRWESLPLYQRLGPVRFRQFEAFP
jgi:hypothetical protein